MSASIVARSTRWMRAAGIRTVILLTLVLLAFQATAVFPASRASAQTPTAPLAAAQQALGATLPQGTDTPPSAVGSQAAAVAPSPASAVVTATTDAAPPPSQSVAAPASKASNPPVTPVTATAAPRTAPADPTTTSAPAPVSTTPAAPSPAAPSTSFTVSAAVKSFLAGLNITLPDGPVTGTLSGSTLTVAVGAPALPVTLPIGAHTLTFAGATLTIDEAAKSLSLSASASSDNGMTGTLTVTVANVSSTDLTGSDLTATLAVTGVPVLGGTVDLSGTLAYSGGKIAASLTGALSSDAVISADLTVKSGSTVRLSTADGFAIDGSAVVGSGDTVFSVDVKGEVHDPKTWSLTVAAATAQTFSPVSGLTITPNFTGTISRDAGGVSFDVSSDETGSWTTGPATFAVNHVEVSTAKPATGLACPAVTDGQIWLDVRGSLTDGAIGLNATGEACVNASDKTFQVSTTTPTGLLAGLFSIDNAAVSVSRNKAGTVSVSASGTLTISGGVATPVQVPVSISIAADGSVVAAGSVDLSQLKLGTGTGTVLVASKGVSNYDPTPLGVTGGPVNLPQGVTVLLNYHPSGDVTRVLNYLKLPVPQTIQAQASLSGTGFATTLALKYGATTSGVTLLGSGTPGGAKIYLNTLSLGLNLNTSNTSVSIAGSAYLALPPLYPGSQGSQVQVTLSGSLTLTANTVGVKIGFDIASPNGWTDAFGIPGVTVQHVAGTLGVEVNAAGIPLPTLSFLVQNLQLPATWANAIGMTPGSTVSLSLALDVNNPIVHLAIAGPTPNSVALTPLAIAKDVPGGNSLPPSVVNAIQVTKAELLFALFGGMDAAGATVNPGATLVFDAAIGGVWAHIDGNVSLLPYPSLTATASVANFAIGSVTFNQGATLGLTFSADPTNPKADVLFTGGFTDSTTGVAFKAKIDLGASTQIANAGVSLSIAGGLPSYLTAQAALQGQVYASTSGVSFAASGNVRFIVGNSGDEDLGVVSFSYSSNGGAAWQYLQQQPNIVANAFRQIYGWSDVTIAQQLRSLKFAGTDVAKGIGQGLSESNAQVTAALYRAGYTASQAAQAVKAWSNAGINDIAAGLQSAGASVDQIVAAAKDAYGNSAATAYNALQAIGQGGQNALVSVANFFNPGSYYVSTRENWWNVPMYLDVAGASQAPNAGVDQWLWNGQDNQQWYVLPTDNGWAEIVNRNSGQCLSVNENSTAAGASLVQYPCLGQANQQWYFTGGTANLGGQSGQLWSRSSGLVAEVAGASSDSGATIDQWHSNGGNNQNWTFTNAIG